MYGIALPINVCVWPLAETCNHDLLFELYLRMFLMLDSHDTDPIACLGGEIIDEALSHPGSCDAISDGKTTPSNDQKHHTKSSSNQGHHLGGGPMGIVDEPCVDTEKTKVTGPNGNCTYQKSELNCTSHSRDKSGPTARVETFSVHEPGLESTVNAECESFVHSCKYANYFLAPVHASTNELRGAPDTVYSEQECIPANLSHHQVKVPDFLCSATGNDGHE